MANVQRGAIEDRSDGDQAVIEIWRREVKDNSRSRSSSSAYVLAGGDAGVVYMIGVEAEKALGEFGLSVDVVSAHLATYCCAHPTATPFDGVQAKACVSAGFSAI